MAKFRVRANRLNVREGPGKQYKVVSQLEQGDVIEPPDISGWVPVEMEDGTIGWVAAEYLEQVEEDDYLPGDAALILGECKRQGLSVPQTAYVMATVEWETAGTFKPVREAFWKTEEWRKANLRYYPYYGRGYVQLTWRENYAKYSERLRRRFPEAGAIDLVSSPDLAMKPEFAAFILVDGFKQGIFTGKKLSDYINENQTDFVSARRCINRLDRADEIAKLANRWLRRLTE